MTTKRLVASLALVGSLLGLGAATGCTATAVNCKPGTVHCWN